jgi:hypothetical protein
MFPNGKNPDALVPAMNAGTDIYILRHVALEAF